MVDLLKLANVIDAAAEHLDAIENEKLSSVRAEKQAEVDKLATAYTAATGDEVPEHIRQKLAVSDKAVVDWVKTVTEKHAGHVESLGGASDQPDAREPLTVKEAADAADEKFLSWLTS